jgi:ABC-type glycerol-3-phosphate transport system substrate-binding protein
MLKFKNKKKILIISLLSLAVLFFSGCSSKPVAPESRVKLEVWGLFDNQTDYEKNFKGYQALNALVGSIQYRKMTPETYRDDIIEALAAGQGPDIILIQNNWLPSFKDKLAPSPAEILGEQKMKKNFVDVVISDFVDDGKTYAVPLSVDTLALFYNKDFFNEAGIIFPPKNWEEFVGDSKKLTRLDRTGQIIRAGAALGTAQNIYRPADILFNLMMQNGTEMGDPSKDEVTFDSGRTGSATVQGSPGRNALDFFVQFSRRSSPYYSWNANMHNSVDAFAEGKLAMMFGYHYQKEAIIAKSPKLNFDIAPLPQLPDTLPVTYANYWGFAVLQNKNAGGNVPNDIRIREAWKLLSFLATRPDGSAQALAVGGSTKGAPPADYDPTKAYLQNNPAPAARRDLIELQKDDLELGVFAMQNLIAKSFRQKNPEVIESVTLEMIDQINRGQLTTSEALGFAVKKINQLMQ